MKPPITKQKTLAHVAEILYKRKHCFIKPFTKQKTPAHVCKVIYKLWYLFGTQQLTITTTSEILHIPLWL